MKRILFILLFFSFSSCVKDSFIELAPKPTFFGVWVGDSVYYYDLIDDSLILNHKSIYSVFSPADTFVFNQNYTYSRVFYSLGKMGGSFVSDSGVFVINMDSLFLEFYPPFFIDSLGFEKLVLLSVSKNKDSLTKFVYKKNASLVSYSQDVFPIWENMCSNCHYKNSKYVSLVPLQTGYENLKNGFSVNGDYSNFAEYIDSINPENSLLYLKIEGTAPGSIMPQPPYSPLPEYQRELILKWIKQGALFN